MRRLLKSESLEFIGLLRKEEGEGDLWASNASSSIPWLRNVVGVATTDGAVEEEDRCMSDPPPPPTISICLRNVGSIGAQCAHDNSLCTVGPPRNTCALQLDELGRILLPSEWDHQP